MAGFRRNLGLGALLGSLALSSPLTAEPPSTTRTLDEWLLFYPAPYPAGNWEPAGLEQEDIWFKAEDGTRLHGWLFSNENARASVLYLHGNAGNLSHRAPMLSYLRHKLAINIFIPDYRGYGRSAGTPTVSGALADARAARRALAEKQGIKEAEVVLMGRSLGGAIAVQLAAELNPRGLVLESTFSSLRAMAAQHYAFLSWVVPEAKLNSSAALPQYNGPLLQSHGSEDSIVPLPLGEALFAAARQPKRFVLIPGGNHNDPQPADYYEALQEFLEALPPPNIRH
jgi:fermentation-respiration switch protein FrsA (DUF1100 family)